jgi:uncharacterized protein
MQAKIIQRKMLLNKMERRFSFSPIGSEKYRAQISGDATSRHINGYGIVFNQKSKIITEYVPEKQEVRSFYEIIAPTALDGILNNGFDVVMDVNHDFEEILARIASKTLTLTKDDIGVRYDFDAANEFRGENVLQMVRRGDYYESSFAFVVADNGDMWTFDKTEGLYTRTILSIEALYDMAICTYRGAYDNTDIENSDGRVYEYEKQDIEVAARKLNELMEKPIIGIDLSTTEDKTVETIINPSRKLNEDFITRIYLKRNWERKKKISR